MIRFETIRAPAQTLPLARQLALLDEIVALNLLLSHHDAFRRNWLERSQTFMADTDLLELAYDGDELVGHCSGKQIDAAGFDVTYIDTYTVHPRLHRSGLGSRLGVRMTWHCLRRARGEFIIAGRTEVPYVAGMVWVGIGAENHYPAYGRGEHPPPQLARIAASVAAQLWPELPFDIETGVLEDAYGGRFLPVPATRYASVQARFDRHVDHERGDAIVQVIWYRSSAWLHLMRHFGARALHLLASR